MVPPRSVPDRDSKYMGEAWLKAAFSKDPSTQVGAVIIDINNVPLGSGYNGPPALIDDDSFDWDRLSITDGLSKYDLIDHAEINAIEYSMCSDLRRATMYVTAMPCPYCMKAIIRKKIPRVVYFDYQSTSNSSLQNLEWREKTIKIANKARIDLQLFTGDLSWIDNWIKRLKEINVVKQ